MYDVFTIGHSTRTIEEFIALLKNHAIQMLIHVRRYPGSRRHPQFNKENLEQSLENNSIDYKHKEKLGGRRGKPKKDSKNDGWRNNGFQAYADYINTSKVQETINELAVLSENKRYALMCAEAVYWRCHRRIVADALVARGITVHHILGPSQLNKHTLNVMAQILEDQRVIYPSEQKYLFGD